MDLISGTTSAILLSNLILANGTKESQILQVITYNLTLGDIIFVDVLEMESDSICIDLYPICRQVKTLCEDETILFK